MLVPVADVDVSVRDVVVVVCIFVVLVCVCCCSAVGVEDVVLVAVDDEVRVVVHDAAAASTLSSVVAFMKAATARHSSRSEDKGDISTAGETSSVMGGGFWLHRITIITTFLPQCGEDCAAGLC